MKTYKHFEFWVQHALPAVFGEELSYYELLCKVVDILNEHADGLNELGEDIDTLRTQLNELRTYVDAYFDRIDVEAYIDSYIQGLIDKGTFPVKSIGPEVVNYTSGNVNMPKNNFKTLGKIDFAGAGLTNHTCQASQVVGTTLYITHHVDNTSPMYISAVSLSNLSIIATSSAGPVIHGNSMTYDSVNNQLIITDTGTSSGVSMHYFDIATMSWVGAYPYKGSADGNISSFAMYDNFAMATLTSTYNCIYYKKCGNFYKSIGTGRIAPTLGNTLKQDACANDKFFAFLSCNMTHDNEESPQYIGRQDYEQNCITIFDISRGFVKNVYFDKYLGRELEGLSVVDYTVNGVRSYRFIITDLYGNVYQLDTDYNSTGYGNISLSGGLFAGIETPWVTFGGDDDSNNITYTDANGTLTIPNEFRAFYNSGSAVDTYISNMIRGQMAPVAFVGFTGIVRQTSNAIRVNISTPKTQMSYAYSVTSNGVAKLSGYTYSDFDGPDNTRRFFYASTSTTTYDNLINRFKTDVAPLITSQYGDITITYQAIGESAFRFPRYYRTNVTYVPLGVTGT